MPDLKEPVTSAKSKDNPTSVGLGGDGDEVSAIGEVERVFGVRLDYDDASDWVTAGDVYKSLNKALSAHEIQARGGWKRFAQALTDETGENPENISPESPLLGPGTFWAGVADVNALLFKLLVIGALVVVVWAAW
jgi:hypothetical protein